jgi:hypothetical protein
MTTDSLVAICDYLFNLIAANKTTVGLPVATDVVNLFYGDQDLIQFVPAICIEPDNKHREYNGVPRRTQNDFRVGILIYHGKVTDPQTNRRDADVMAEAVETLVHSQPQFGGLVISSLVTDIDSGYQTKAGNTVLRSSRLTVTGRSQTLLPPSP